MFGMWLGAEALCVVFASNTLWCISHGNVQTLASTPCHQVLNLSTLYPGNFASSPGNSLKDCGTIWQLQLQISSNVHISSLVLSAFEWTKWHLSKQRREQHGGDVSRELTSSFRCISLLLIVCWFFANLVTAALCRCFVHSFFNCSCS